MLNGVQDIISSVKKLKNKVKISSEGDSFINTKIGIPFIILGAIISCVLKIKKDKLKI